MNTVQQKPLSEFTDMADEILMRNKDDSAEQVSEMNAERNNDLLRSTFNDFEFIFGRKI